MRRIVSCALALTLALAAVPAPADAQARRGQSVATGQISGSITVPPQAAAGVTVRLRNIATAMLAGTTKPDASGNYTFMGIPPGDYLIEIVGAKGEILGTSTPLLLTPGSMSMAGISVSGTSFAAGAGAGAAGAAAAGAAGAAAAAAAAPGVAGAFYLGSSLGLALLAGAAAAVVAGTIAVRNDASPSR